LKKSPKYVRATTSPASAKRGAPVTTDPQSDKKPEGGFEKSNQQDLESGIALGQQPARVEFDIGSRMPDRK
jgi:hypothetical protein